MFISQLSRAFFLTARRVVPSSIGLRSLSVLPYSGIRSSTPFILTQKFSRAQLRSFGTSQLTPTQIKEKIIGCGIDDSGKEKVIEQEVKKGNFEALRQVAEEFVSESGLKVD